jgi:hypothetical protein
MGSVQTRAMKPDEVLLKPSVVRVDVIAQDVEFVGAWYVRADLHSWDHCQSSSSCGI